MIREHEFARIFDEFAPKIFTYCYFRVRSREEAEDLASQTFLRAWDHVSAGKEVENITGFLYRIARNLIIDHYRKAREQREVSLDDAKHPIDIAEHPTIAYDLDQKFLGQEVLRKIDLLTEEYREALLLRYAQGLSVKEIAAVVGDAENTVSVRIHRALEKLRALFKYV